MYNSTFMVGRLVDKPKIKEADNGKNFSNITLAVQRPYKNDKGEYDTDFVDCVLWGDVAKNTAEYCEKGDLVGIKGRLQTSLYQKDGKTNKSMEIIAEKISFLASTQKHKEVENKKSEKTKNKSKDKEL